MNDVTEEILIDFLRETQRLTADTDIRIDDLSTGRHTLVIKTSDKPPKKAMKQGVFNRDYFESWFSPTKKDYYLNKKEVKNAI